MIQTCSCRRWQSYTDVDQENRLSTSLLLLYCIVANVSSCDAHECVSAVLQKTTQAQQLTDLSVPSLPPSGKMDLFNSSRLLASPCLYIDYPPSRICWCHFQVAAYSYTFLSTWGRVQVSPFLVLSRFLHLFFASFVLLVCLSAWKQVTGWQLKKKELLGQNMYDWKQKSGSR